MTRRRKLAVFLALIPVLLLALLITVPLLFRGRIEARAQAAINDAVGAQVSWGGLGLSVLRDFPNVTLRLDDVVVAGIDRFEGDTLLALDRFEGVLDLGSVLGNLRRGDPVVVRSIALDRPVVRLVALEDGTANWDIVRARGPAPEQAAPERGVRALEVSLRRLELSDGRISIDDRKTGLVASVEGLRQSLSGDFGKTRFTLRSRTAADSVSVRFAGVPYLSDARLEVDATLDADMAAKRFTIQENRIRLNELVLESSGTISPAGDSVAVDIAFRAPSTAFGDILSLVPALYAQSFATLETDGTMAVEGWVRGGIGKDVFPALAVEAAVADGRFRYPDLPLAARDIAIQLAVTNPGGDVDSTTLRLDRVHVVLGDDAVDGSFVLRTPVSDPDVEFRVAGRVDLANVGRAVKLERVDQLAGVVVADASMRARRSDVNAGLYERIDAAGDIAVTDFVLSKPDMPRAVHIDEALLRLTPRHAELAAFHGRSGNSDLSATGRLENLLGYAMRGETLRGEARLVSERVDLNEWRSGGGARAVPVPPNLDLELSADVGRLTFADLEMSNASGELHVANQRAMLEQFRMDVLGGTMSVSGFYETTTPEQPTFDLQLGLADIDVPGAFRDVATIRAFAPIAQYAQGSASADLQLGGALGQDMAPVLAGLSGLGSLRTSGLVIQDFPAFERLADLLEIRQLADPALRDLRSSFAIADGRLHVRPFDVEVGPLTMNVVGSNGLDHSLDYQLSLQVPRSLLGDAANRVATRLASRASRAGLDIDVPDVIGVSVRLTGTVTAPTLTTDLHDVAGSATRGVEQALREEVATRVDSIEQRIDSAQADAQRRAEAEAQRIIAEAEQQAAAIRQEARLAAERVRQEGYARADSLVARADNPVARVAARAAAERLRSETDAQAERIVREADARAEAIVAEARRRAGGSG